MTKQFKPIAMRCTQEQFETLINDILKRGGSVVNGESSNCDFLPYFTNNIDGVYLQFGSIYDSAIHDFNRTVYETFDRNIFLEACGWKDAERKIIGYKRNPKMDVTARQLAYLLNCSFTEKGDLFFWLDSYLGFIAQVEYITRAKSLNIIGEDKMLVPVYEEEEPITDKTYTIDEYNTFNEMQKLALNEFVLVHKSKVK